MIHREFDPTASPGQQPGETLVPANAAPTKAQPSFHEEDLLIRPVNQPPASATFDVHMNGGSEVIDVTSPALSFTEPSPRPSSERFVAMTKWRGKVVSINGATFSAILEPMIGDEFVKQAEVFLEDVPLGDRPLVTPGAIFYWTIGYHDAPSGNRTRASVMRFRRFAELTEAHLAAAKEQAKLYKAVLDDE